MCIQKSFLTKHYAATSYYATVAVYMSHLNVFSICKYVQMYKVFDKLNDYNNIIHSSYW